MNFFLYLNVLSTPQTAIVRKFEKTIIETQTHYFRFKNTQIDICLNSSFAMCLSFQVLDTKKQP